MSRLRMMVVVVMVVHEDGLTSLVKVRVPRFSRPGGSHGDRESVNGDCIVLQVHMGVFCTTARPQVRKDVESPVKGHHK